MTRVRVPAAAAALLGCSSELQPEGFEGDSYFDRHLEEESHFFSLSLPSRSIFILAESALEKKLWMVGIHALLSGQARKRAMPVKDLTIKSADRLFHASTHKRVR